MNGYKHSSFSYMTREEEKEFEAIRIRQSEIVYPLLDSSLTIQTKLKLYDIKVVECGKYKNVYFLDKSKVISDKNRVSIQDKELFRLDTKIKKPKELKEIELKNLKRTRISLANLVKANIDEFKTFITLTFDSDKVDFDINDISQCNKKFNVWKTYIKKLKKDFMYVCVPEFQKRGAVHYHLLTNVKYEDFDLLSKEERKIWQPKTKKWKIGRDIKGWKYGINMAIQLENINLVGYITKYLQKDVDSRLFGQRKYFHSRNLKQPTEYYLDTKNMNYREFEEFLKIQNSKKVFEKKYKDHYGNEIFLIEYFNDTC